ncbi:adenine phosphoribosyltransferase [Proteiniclasticum sp. QWL-01]|uniref:adenine phosphoribosyltransferase n=1 Tax=Proteiniclasticum sp. QWL-01 TaxID=3036945 RepID=UPI00220A5E41|nr:adenine phosphoribosyltransferase [Proteiniclasticum sp. QWL-01]UUM12628.1 adenine phosphoribosyltransferase [Clostridiaceae bacterium HFYG-1003]WFF74183.1 adenine phosphoribosyltransferase [Proteiniclasticum sp. QWL-01]
MDFKEHIRVIEDFPKPGISFKDITTVIKNGPVFKEMVDAMAARLRDLKIDAVAGPEARGFIFGVPVAYALEVGFLPIRKKGKLPSDTYSLTYDLEYGKDTLEVHKDAIWPGMRVAIIDDLLATGGTIAACKDLLELAGAEVVSVDFVIELTGLKGRDKLAGYNVESMVTYEF